MVSNKKKLLSEMKYQSQTAYNKKSYTFYLIISTYHRLH